MTWFKVDDKLPRNRKTRAVRRSHPTKRRDAAPFGIWALAGAESDDGFIATEVLEEWDDDAHALAERLVAAGLWHPATRDGEPGFEFHDWADANPADPATSGTFGNHVRWHKKRGKVDPECPHCTAASGRYRGDDRGDIGCESPPESLPSRPDPTRPEGKPSRSAVAEPVVDAIAEDFDAWYSAYPRKVGRGAAAKAYRRARKTADATTLRAAVEQQAATLMARGSTFCPHPATWLNGERWADQQASSVPAVIPPTTGKAAERQAMYDRQMERAVERERQMGIRP